MSAEKSGAFRVPPDPAHVEQLVREGLAEAGDEESRAWLLALSGVCSVYWRAMTGGDPVPLEERIQSVQDACALAESLDQPELQTFAIRSLSELYYVTGSYKLSVETARRQLPLLDRVPSDSERALALFEVSVTMADLAGAYEEAIQLARQSHALAKHLSPHERMHGLYGQMKPLYHLGRWGEVLTLLDEHLEYYQLEADVFCFGVQGGPMFGAMTLARMGQGDRARELAEMVHSGHNLSPRAEGVRAWLTSALGDPESARSLAGDLLANSTTWWRAPEAALAMLESLAALEDWQALEEGLATVRRFSGESALLGPACDRAEGLALAAIRDLDRAAKLLTRSLAAFERLGERYEAAKTREPLASLSPADEARDLLVESLRSYEDLGARPDAERARVLLDGTHGT